jgi:hypothetical protein
MIRQHEEKSDPKDNEQLSGMREANCNEDKQQEKMNHCV